MGVFEISARAACKQHGLDQDEWWEYIADLVGGTNAAFSTMSGGVNRGNVADYSKAMAAGIKQALADGRDPWAMSFMDLYDWRNDPRPGPWCTGGE